MTIINWFLDLIITISNNINLNNNNVSPMSKAIIINLSLSKNQ